MSEADKLFEQLGYMIDDDENRVIYDDRDINIILDKETKTLNTDNPITLNLQEVKEINLKCKELRWLDE